MSSFFFPLKDRPLRTAFGRNGAFRQNMVKFSAIFPVDFFPFAVNVLGQQSPESRVQTPESRLVLFP